MAAAAEQAAQALLQERTAAVADAETAAQQPPPRSRLPIGSFGTPRPRSTRNRAPCPGGAYLASRGPQDLADRSAALAIVGDLRQQALSRATAGANRQAEARKVADLARTQQTSAAAATSASRAASASARSAAQETALIAAEQDHRIVVLAAARQTSVEVERARQDGLAAEAAAAEAARGTEEAAIQARPAGEAEAAAQAEAAAKAQADVAAKAEREAVAGQAGCRCSPGRQDGRIRCQPGTPADHQAGHPDHAGDLRSPCGHGSSQSPRPRPAAADTAPRHTDKRAWGTNANAIYSAVRTRFGITNIGGYRAGDWGDHGAGNAVDVSDQVLRRG